MPSQLSFLLPYIDIYNGVTGSFWGRFQHVRVQQKLIPFFVAGGLVSLTIVWKKHIWMSSYSWLFLGTGYMEFNFLWKDLSPFLGSFTFRIQPRRVWQIQISLQGRSPPLMLLVTSLLSLSKILKIIVGLDIYNQMPLFSHKIQSSKSMWPISIFLFFPEKPMREQQTYSLVLRNY